MLATQKVILVIVSVSFALLRRSNSSASDPSTFEYVAVTGSEGTYTESTIQLKFQPTAIALRGFGAQILILNKGTGKLGRVHLIDTTGTGFSSEEEAFKSLGRCQTCKAIDATVQFGNVKNPRHFSDANTEWYVFKQDPGFVVMSIPKGDTVITNALSSIVLTVDRIEKLQETTSVNLYFENSRIRPIENCREVTPVPRHIPKTSQPATIALCLLLDGPSDDEREDGYLTDIPDDVWLNSVNVRDGVARADFSPRLEQGGGSCHMSFVREQITQTLLQFPTITKVEISINGRTEDILQP